jgi:hypothetical protein
VVSRLSRPRAVGLVRSGASLAISLLQRDGNLMSKHNQKVIKDYDTRRHSKHSDSDQCSNFRAPWSVHVSFVPVGVGRSAAHTARSEG